MILPHVAKTDLPAVHAALARRGGSGRQMSALPLYHRLPRHELLRPCNRPLDPRCTGHCDTGRSTAPRARSGPLKIKISGCINACGHHHVGHIGILGLDRGGVETYRITLGGCHRGGSHRPTHRPGFSYEEIVPAIERLLKAYLDLRESEIELFIDAVQRVGHAPFKAALYSTEAHADAA